MILWFLRLFKAFRHLEGHDNDIRDEYLKLDALYEEVKVDRDQFKQRAESAEHELSTFRERALADIQKITSEMLNIRESYNAEVDEHARTRIRLDAALEERTRLWTMVETALAGERSALRMEINHLVQKSGGSPPYPEAHTLDHVAPYQAPGAAGRGARILTSQRAAQAQREALEVIAMEMAPKPA